MRIWGKIWKDNRLLKDAVIENNSEQTRTAKVLEALHDLCMEFDLSVPLWLDPNISEFQRRAKTRFSQDNFVETISFDYLELHVIEED
ncbi:hypothetical protein [Hominifimenecus sp. rT4P-3]|uniref:hypothetical protein n=1 Tax=Hominifimenecus sp. rT4P-3 TaxID=3242979 RepID=UPI003DA25F8B